MLHVQGAWGHLRTRHMEGARERAGWVGAGVTCIHVRKGRAETHAAGGRMGSRACARGTECTGVRRGHLHTWHDGSDGERRLHVQGARGHMHTRHIEGAHTRAEGGHLHTRHTEDALMRAAE